MRSAVIASFYILLPIILQDRNLSAVFEKNSDFLVSLLSFANSPTNSEKFDIMTTLNYFMYRSNRQGRHHEEEGKIAYVRNTNFIYEREAHITFNILI